MRFDILTQGEMNLPLSEFCEDVNVPGQFFKRYGRRKVGTHAHLHAAHAPGVLVAIGAEEGYSQ